MKNELRLDEIIQYPLSEGQYIREKTEKNQIVLHHTASGRNPYAVINYWNQTREKVATCVVIGGDGSIVQCFASEYWAGHIGNDEYSRNSIGIEICSWGFLEKKGEKYISWAGVEVPANEVIEYQKNFKGKKYFQKYTQAQIDAVEKLLRYWNKKYGIPLDYNEKDMWGISENAQNKVAGIYTHNSFLASKSDIHPQPEIIKMLKNLKNKDK